MRRFNPSLSDDDANKKGKKNTQPIKQKYDRRMTKYKKWVNRFEDRRGRRLIIKICTKLAISVYFEGLF
ncbi:MAG: hypothetical protein KGD58_05870 [Candidatus Lokiarchaeota archaeon]|nr:hypothetical protein [Candidatus Lokiarchaeota archaeon]